MEETFWIINAVWCISLHILWQRELESKGVPESEREKDRDKEGNIESEREKDSEWEREEQRERGKYREWEWEG